MTRVAPPSLPSLNSQQSQTMPRGLLVLIEGLDRSGKTTQCSRLLTSISASHPARLQKFPDRTTPTGTLINSYLLNQTQQDDRAIHLIFSANRWEARDQILADLNAGITVVVDRYSFSGAVYSAAKGVDGLDVEWAWACEVGLPAPDLVVFLDVREEVQEERGGYGEERYEKREMQRRVRGLFANVLGLVEAGGPGVGLIRRIDASVGVEEVERQVWECYVEGREMLRAKEERGEGKIGVLGKLGL